MWQGLMRLPLLLILFLVGPPYIHAFDYLKVLQAAHKRGFVTPDVIRQDSVVYIGSALRLRNVIRRAAEGHAIKVGAVGGSISTGQGTGGAKTYGQRFVDWLNGTFPHGNHTYASGAVPGVRSSYLSVCLDYHLPMDLDLVFVEFAANDAPAPDVAFSTPERAALERLLRKLLNAPSRPAVVLVNMYSYIAMLKRYWGNAERDFMELATYYHLPTVSFKAGAFQAIVSDRQVGALRLFRVNKIYNGGVHLSKFGHEVMGEVLATMVMQVMQQLAMDSLLDIGNRPSVALPWDPAMDIPAPMISGNYEAPRSVCLIHGGLRKAVIRDTDWEWRDESKPNSTQPKFGYISTTVGSELVIKINSTAASHAGGSTHAAALPVGIQIAHLRSYMHMGQAGVTCVSGCSCEASVLEGHTHEKTSLTIMHTLAVSQHPACVISISVLPTTESKEHKVKIIGVVISEQAGVGNTNPNWLRAATTTAASKLAGMLRRYL